MILQSTTNPTRTSKYRVIAFKLANPNKKKFKCPICTYEGPFRDFSPSTGKRLHAKCPNCGALERHRLQFLTINNVFAGFDTKTMRMLHFAPEPFFTDLFRANFGTYETADIAMPGVDHTVDLQELPFPSNSYDVVYASHVLEHVPNDQKAISEIARVLAPGGIAILPVPIINPTTIEYAKPNPHETMHVRAPGIDYFDRYMKRFDKVDLYRSEDFPEIYQTFSYADMTNIPNKKSPHRTAMSGTKHSDIVPVCYALTAKHI